MRGHIAFLTAAAAGFEGATRTLAHRIVEQLPAAS
jgi:hypothetical protein